MNIRTATLTASLLLGSYQAHAAEGKLLLDQLVALAKVEGTTITWGSIREQNDASFSLSDVRIEDDKGKITTVETISVQNLRDANGRLTYDSVAMVGVQGSTDNDGTITLGGIASSRGDWPSGIWEDGLTAEEKRQRVRFGNFSISDIKVTDEKVRMSLDSVVVSNADIPLDYRYEPEQIENATGAPAAPLTIDQFSMVGLNGTGKAETGQDVDFALKSISLSDINFPSSMDVAVFDWMKIYSAASIDGISASLAGEPVFRLDNMSGTISDADADGTVSARSNMSGLYVNLLAIPDPNSQAVFKQLGYDKIEGEMAGTGTYNPNTGRASVFDTAIKLRDMFDLYIDYAISGYTADVAQKLSKAQMEIATGKDQMQVLGPMLAELSGIKLDSFGIELEDHSITGRLLDFQARQMGTTGEQLAAGAPMMIGMGMGALNMPGLTEMVTSAVGKFLTEKGSISVRAEPTEPVSIVNVVMASQSDPTQIPNMLNLKVTAR
ncbi:MAG: hypothetical protein ABJM29_05010 [Rhizobiaceae bacterium]